MIIKITGVISGIIMTIMTAGIFNNDYSERGGHYTEKLVAYTAADVRTSAAINK